MSDILLFLEPNDLYYQHLEAALIMWMKTNLVLRKNRSQQTALDGCEEDLFWLQLCCEERERERERERKREREENNFN